MKLLLMADGFVGLEIAGWLVDKYPEDISAIITTTNNDIYKLAIEHGIGSLVFNSGQQIVDYFDNSADTPDVGFLAWWPKIIKNPLLGFPVHGFINTHPSLLPYNRGKHYNFWALVEKSPFGVTFHFVDEGIDSGDIVVQRHIPYGWEDTGETLYQKATQNTIELFKDFYPTIRSLKIPRSSQEKGGSFHKSDELESASHIVLDEKYTARDLLNLLRARTFKGYPACWFEENCQKYEVRIQIKRKT